MFGAISVRSRDPVLRQDSARARVAPRDLPRAADPIGHCDISAYRPKRPSNAAAEASHRYPHGFAQFIGGLFFLASVTLVAAATIVVFFGAGFLMLAPPVRGTISEIIPQPKSEVQSPTYSTSSAADVDHRPLGASQADAAADTHQGQNSTFLTAVTDAPVNGAADALLQGARTGTSTPAASHNAPAPKPRTAATNALAPKSPNLSVSEITELLEHGDALLRTGDIASARLFYERAADAGDGRAALRLGITFDPAFRGRARLGEAQADAAEARSWYIRALDLGVTDARQQLNSLDRRQGK